MWYHTVIGEERCPIVDTWWQTETGSIMVSPVPGVTVTKPGSCTLPLPGFAVDIVDDEGNAVSAPDRGGYLVVRRPWPSMLRTIWNDNARYIETYWARFQNRFYVAGDGAHRDADGYFWILGRIDDVLNVSGHRLGTMEVESALVAHPRVAEAAVVGKPHDIKGEAVFAYVVCRGQKPDAAEVPKFTEELRRWVGEQVGAIAKPDEIRFTEVLPKTRSGKIMRRLLRAIARGEEITQDVSTLENPAHRRAVARRRGCAGAFHVEGREEGREERRALAKRSAQRRSARSRRSARKARREARWQGRRQAQGVAQATASRPSARHGQAQGAGEAQGSVRPQGLGETRRRSPREAQVLLASSLALTAMQLLRLLYVQVLLAIVAGVLIGHYAPDLGIQLKPLGDGFIRLIRMLIAPIIFCTVVLGISGMDDLRSVGRTGLLALGYFEAVTTLALIVGLVVINLVGPGHGMHVDPAALDASRIANYANEASHLGMVDYLLNVIPTSMFDAFARGDILQVLVVAILSGFALQKLGERAATLRSVIEGFSKLLFTIVGFIMRVAPIGALGAMAYTIGSQGLGALRPLAGLMACFYATCLLFVFGVLGLVARCTASRSSPSCATSATNC